MPQDDSFDAFLELFRGSKIVKGESRDAVFGPKGACEIESFTLGGGENVTSDLRQSEETKDLMDSMPFSMDAPGAKTLDKFTFTVTKFTDSASPALFMAYLQTASLKHKPFDKAIVTFRKSAGKNQAPYLIFEFEEVYVVSYTLSIDGNSSKGGEGKDTVTFCFSKATFRYSPQTQAGKLGSEVSASWDFRNSAKVKQQ